MKKILFQEKLTWYQKSWNNWLLFNDKNIKYFHASTIVQKKCNNVKKLKNDDGVWVEDDITFQSIAINFFEKLFSKDHFTFEGSLILKSFLILEDVAIKEMKGPINIEKSKKFQAQMVYMPYFSKANGRILGNSYMI